MRSDAIDPITLEALCNRLGAILHEMQYALVRAERSVLIEVAHAP
jgi:N-methylhydantoinase B/oxoprolinase/acetone carboxylase alpha subunit